MDNDRDKEQKIVLSIEDFNREEFEEYGHNIYVHKTLLLDMPLYRYMFIEHLIDLLSSRTLYVANRRRFSDQREQGRKWDLHNAFSPPSIQYKSKRKTEEMAQLNIKLRKECYSTCISCWTKNGNEDIMLWNCYGKNICRISTTLGRFVNSIKPIDSLILIAPVKYTSTERDDSFQSMIFNKYEAYSSEQEIRLCVLNTDDANFISLNVDIEKLINEIILAPFFSTRYRTFLKQSIEQQYVFLQNKINFSHLLEYKG